MLAALVAGKKKAREPGERIDPARTKAATNTLRKLTLALKYDQEELRAAIAEAQASNVPAELLTEASAKLTKADEALAKKLRAERRAAAISVLNGLKGTPELDVDLEAFRAAIAEAEEAGVKDDEVASARTCLEASETAQEARRTAQPSAGEGETNQEGIR